MASARITSRVIKDIDPGILEKLRQRIVGTRTSTVNVGFPTSAGQHDEADMSVAQVAAVHEFGSPSRGIPERSFLRAGIRRHAGDYRSLNRKTLVKVLKGEMTIEQALGLLGTQAASDVQMEIANGEFAPLTAETIRRKTVGGRVGDKPLIDSGQMRQSVHWEYGDD